MSGEITITSNMSISGTEANSNENVKFARTSPATFRADMVGRKGPSPGQITAVSTGQGTTVDLSQLTNPRFFQLLNYDPVNFVELGVEVAAVFHALIKVGPGKSYANELAPGLIAANLRILADTASCEVVFNCFEL